jgi:hypothetical protein
LRAGRLHLEFEPFADTFNERQRIDLDLPPLLSAARPPVETSFIALRLIDQKGLAVADRLVQIELPDGSVHRTFTDPNGFARVAGFTQDGTAKVRFPGFDELDFTTKGSLERVVIPVTNQREAAAVADEPPVEPPEEEPATDPAEAPSAPPLDALDVAVSDAATNFVEFTLVDEQGTPVGGIAYRVTSEDGSVHEGTSDETGFVRIEGLTAASCSLILTSPAAPGP